MCHTYLATLGAVVHNLACRAPARLLNLFVLAANDLSFLPFVDFAVHTRNSHYQPEFGDDNISPLQPKVRLTSELLIFAYIYGRYFQSNQILVKH